MDYPDQAGSTPAEPSRPARRGRSRKPATAKGVKTPRTVAPEPAPPPPAPSALSGSPQEAPGAAIEQALEASTPPADMDTAPSTPEIGAAPVREPMTIAVNADQPVNLSLHFAVNDARPVSISITSNQPDQPEKLMASYGWPPQPPLTAGLRREMVTKEPNAVVGVLDYGMRILKGYDFYIQYKDIFAERIYHFEASRPDPLIVDGGSNIGMSILYFKHMYPRSRVVGFEPSPDLFRILRENVERNGLSGVTLLNAGLGAREGTVGFDPDDQNVGGHFLEPGQDARMTVVVKPLSEFLTEPVDFLKLNIEGQELAVLQEVEDSGKMSQIRELVLEFHGMPQGGPRLSALLDLLERQGFRYLIHDFDPQTNIATKPPFRLGPDTRWFCLIYAKRF